MNQRKIKNTHGNTGKNRWTTIYAMLEYRNMSISDFSKKTGIPINTLCRWLRDKPPIVDRLNVMAEALNVPLEIILASDLLDCLCLGKKESK